MNTSGTIMNKEQADCLKIPVVVGVTGHIDIAEEESWVLEQLEKFWVAVRQIVGEETPIVLLSSIAQGADHYVVKSMPKDIKRYCVILPFAQKDYEHDFVKYAMKPTALEEFRQDLAGAYKVIQCGAEVGNYAAASDYVRSRSDILITLWDGRKSLNVEGEPKPGGTYHQIRTAYDMDDILVHHQEKAHLIINLTVSRKSEHKKNEDCVCSFPDVSASTLNVVKWDEDKGYSTQTLDEWVVQFLKKIEAESQETRDWEKIKNWVLGKHYTESKSDDDDIDIDTVLLRIRKHNKQRLQIPTELENRNYLLKYGKLKKDSKDFAIIQDDFARYEYFDKEAEGHQNTHKSQFAWIALLSVIVGLLGQAWGDVTFAADEGLHESIMHIVILLYLLGCLWLFTWGARINRQNHYGQYVQPRVISELMRLKMFWKLTGIKDSFVDYILKDCANYWFALPVCNWEVWDEPLTQEQGQYIEEGEGLSAVCKGWLIDQKDDYYNGYLLPDPNHFLWAQDGEKCKGKAFFSKAWRKDYFKKYERLDGYFSLLKTIFTWGGFILATLLIVVFLTSLIWHFDHTEFLHLSYYREFIVGICPFVVATLGWLLEKNNWDSLAKQYRATRDLFDKAIRIVNDDANNNLDTRRRTIQELMLFCHRENTDWKNIKNDSKPEPMM